MLHWCERMCPSTHELLRRRCCVCNGASSDTHRRPGVGLALWSRPLESTMFVLQDWRARYQARDAWVGFPSGTTSSRFVAAAVPLRPTCQRLANDSKAMRQSACWGHSEFLPDGRSSTLLGRAGLCIMCRNEVVRIWRSWA